jgi:predicted RNase H-like HicB family nuclease
VKLGGRIFNLVEVCKISTILWLPFIIYVCNNKEGNNLSDALEMAHDAISMWLCDAEDNKENIPPAIIFHKFYRML